LLLAVVGYAIRNAGNRMHFGVRGRSTVRHHQLEASAWPPHKHAAAKQNSKTYRGIAKKKSACSPAPSHRERGTAASRRHHAPLQSGVQRTGTVGRVEGSRQERRNQRTRRMCIHTRSTQHTGGGGRGGCREAPITGRRCSQRPHPQRRRHQHRRCSGTPSTRSGWSCP
jgi:hypothetical protein